MTGKLNAKQEAFAVAVVNNGGDKVAAYKEAGYSQKMSMASMGKEADNLFHHPKISPRISQLQKEAGKLAKERFSISVERRLEWLEEIVNAGLSTYHDQLGNERRENLTASRSAIETMNSMLGVGESDQEAEALSITFNVSNPVGDIKITRGDSES